MNEARLNCDFHFAYPKAKSLAFSAAVRGRFLFAKAKMNQKAGRVPGFIDCGHNWARGYRTTPVNGSNPWPLVTNTNYKFVMCEHRSAPLCHSLRRSNLPFREYEIAKRTVAVVSPLGDRARRSFDDRGAAQVRWLSRQKRFSRCRLCVRPTLAL